MKPVLSVFCSLALALQMPAATFPFSSWSGVTDNFNFSNGSTLEGQDKWVNAFNPGSIKVATSGSNHGFYGTIAGTSVDYIMGLTSWGDQTVTCVIVNVTGTTVTSAGVAARCNNISGGNAYFAEYIGGTIYLGKINSGVDSGAFTSVAQSMAVGNSLRMIVSGSGSATRITVKVDTGSGFTTVINAANPGGTYISNGGPGIVTPGSSSSTAYFGLFSATTP